MLSFSNTIEVGDWSITAYVSFAAFFMVRQHMKTFAATGNAIEINKQADLKEVTILKIAEAFFLKHVNYSDYNPKVRYLHALKY